MGRGYAPSGSLVIGGYVLLALSGVSSQPLPAGSRVPAPLAGSGAAAPAWTYRENHDDMRGTSERIARLTSDNQLIFDIPYNHGTTGVLEVRQEPRLGARLVLVIPRGQIVCESHSGDSIAIRFDAGPIEQVGCHSVTAGSTNLVFLHSTKRVLARLRSSRKAIVEAVYLDEGARQLTFTTAGLRWP